MATTRLKGIWIPENIIFDMDLSTTEKFVLSVILYLSEKRKMLFCQQQIYCQHYKCIPIVKNANTYNCERLSPIATNNYISGQKELSPIVNKCKDIKRNITNKNNYIEREYPDEYWNQFYVN